MADSVLTSKTSTMNRCVARTREEYDKVPSTFARDASRQDVAMLNILGACAAALDIGYTSSAAKSWVSLRVRVMYLSCFAVGGGWRGRC